MTYYCYPNVGRSGLGNCMLVWARAVVTARTLGASVIAPDWFQLRWGPVLRKEPTRRFYRDEFTNAGYIKGLQKRWLLLACRRVDETAVTRIDAVADGAASRTAVVVEFSGLGEYFRPLIPHRSFLQAEIQRIVAPRAERASAAAHPPFIAAHVRRGDLTRQRIATSEILQFTPLDWFVDAARALRNDPRWTHVPIKVMSDGSPDELQDLLRLDNCELIPPRSAIADILLLSRADVLLASGYSTFSMWGSFLGRMPTLYAPGKMQQCLFDPGCGIFEGEWHSGTALPSGMSSARTSATT